MALVITSCSGYKPMVYYVKKEIKDKVFVKLYVNLSDPKNAVLIKDSIDRLIVQKLNKKLVYDESLADTVINLRLNSVNFYPLQYDTSGYIQIYKAVVGIFASYHQKENKNIKSFIVSGENNFSVDTSDNDDKITDRKRYEAIKEASDDALDEVLSKIAINSYEK